jgi:hypothetical protein
VTHTVHGAESELVLAAALATRGGASSDAAEGDEAAASDSAE